MSQVIDIVSLYPKDMNIYGDSGNVLSPSSAGSRCTATSRAYTPTTRAATGPSTWT